MLLALLTLALTHGDSLTTLTDDSFEATLKQFQHAMVAFTAPWCQHSKALLPELVSAARALHERPGAVPGAVPFAQVDGTVDEELTQAQGVESFPTIKWFVDGEARDYKGVRNATAIARCRGRRRARGSIDAATRTSARRWMTVTRPWRRARARGRDGDRRRS